MRREVLGAERWNPLAFLSRFGVAGLLGSGLDRVVMFTEMFAFRGDASSCEACCLLRVMSFVLVELLVVRFLVVLAGPARDSPGSNSTGESFARGSDATRFAAARADARDRSPRGFRKRR